MKTSRLVAAIVGVYLLSLALPAEAVVLRFKPKVNSIVTHKVTMSGQMEMSSEMLPEPMRLQMTMTMTERQKVLGETPEGLKIQTTTSDAKMTMKGLKAAGNSRESQQIPDSTIVMIMDDRGRVKEIVSTDIPGAQGQMPFSNETLASLSGMTGFPEGEVKVNETWRDEVELPGAAGMPEVNVTVNSRLLELLTYEGRKCAKIRSAFKGPLSCDLSQLAGAPAGAAGTVEAMIQGTFTQYYDYENSVWVGGEGQMTMNMTMNLSSEGRDMGAMTTKMAMTMKMQMAK